MYRSDIVDIARQFANTYVRPRAQAWEDEKRQPVEAFREAAKLGLLAFETPIDCGGAGANFATKLEICEVMSRVDMGFTFAMINTQNIAVKLATQAGEPRQEMIAALLAGEIFGATALSEPGAGSDFAGITMSARRTGSGWVLNGTKGWITNATIADVFVVYAQTQAESGWRGIASFLVDARKPGFERGEIYQTFGGHAIGAGEFKLNEFVVREQDMLSPPGEGFKSALGLVNGARAYVAAMCCGMIAGALNLALDYGEMRQAFGQPVINNQGLMWSLVDVATRLEALRGLTEKAGKVIDNGGDPVFAAAVAKKYAGEITSAAITSCIQAMGANGLKSENSLGRHLACAKIAAFADGSTEMMNERIGVSIRKNRP